MKNALAWSVLFSRDRRVTANMHIFFAQVHELIQWLKTKWLTFQLLLIPPVYWNKFALRDAFSTQWSIWDEAFRKQTANGWKRLIIFAKRSILHVQLGSDYVSAFLFKVSLKKVKHYYQKQYPRGFPKFARKVFLITLSWLLSGFTS